MKSARASAIRIRQPPENSFVFFCCFSGVKPGVGGRKGGMEMR